MTELPPGPGNAIEVTVGIVRPGDKLVVALDRRLDMATYDRIRERLGARLPGVEIVPIEAAALVVYRHDDSD